MCWVMLVRMSVTSDTRRVSGASGGDVLVDMFVDSVSDMRSGTWGSRANDMSADAARSKP